MKRFLGILFLLALQLPSFAAGGSVLVFAAASLTDSLQEIASQYERQTGDRVVFNFGASSTLARQIEEGAPADIFLSADEAKMNALEKKSLILPGTRKSRLSNLLVIIVSIDSAMAIHSPQDLANPTIHRVALADPQAVPAGIYAREYFQKLRLWPRIQSKVVPVDNVRAALAAVESGNVDAGVVYKTDAAISKKVKVAYAVPRADGPDINYPMARLKDSKNPVAAEKFFAFLDSRAATAVFEEFGFIVRN